MPPLPSRFGKFTYRFSRWLDKLTYQLSLPAPLGRKGRRRPNMIGQRIQPRLEHLEQIILLNGVTWTGAAGDNNWDTGGNWSTGTTPGSGDDVTINVASPITITHSAAVTDTINSLVSNAAILLSGGSLNVNTTLSDSAGLTLAGGTLGNATVQSGTALTGTAAGGTLNNVVLDTNLDLQTNNAASLTITTALTLNGADINLGSSDGVTSGTLNFSGNVTVGGSGTIFCGTNAGNQINLDSNLTLGTHITLLGGNVTISGGSGSVLVNQGDIVDNRPGQTVLIDPSGTFTNDGQVEAEGGTITVNPGTLSNFSAGTLSGGLWRAAGGALRLVGDYITTNAATLILDGPNSAIYSDTGTTSALAGFAVNSASGHFFLEDGANFAAGGAFTNSGDLYVYQGSTFTLTAANNYTQTAGFTLVGGGTLALGTGRVLINAGTLEGNGTIAGSVTIGNAGTLSLVNFADSGQPTALDSPSNFAIEGGLLLQGLLEDDIAGNQANGANGYEQLAIGGNFENDGTVNLLLSNGFTPATFDTFEVIEFASRTMPMSGTVNVFSGSLAAFFDNSSLWLLPASYQTAAVTTTADSGAGSLRAAIDQANSASAGIFTAIVFNIPTTDGGYNSSTGVWTIAPASALPGISNPVLLDGATQPGYSAKPILDLSGTSAGSTAIGLNLTGGKSIVKGLAINQFGSDGIVLASNGGDDVEGNYIGTDATGTVALANGGGVYVSNSTNNTIGGTTALDRNIISGNAQNGVQLSGSGATGNVIEGNYIGTDTTGTTALGNSQYGVYQNSASDNSILGNTISGNGLDGININNNGGLVSYYAANGNANDSVGGNNGTFTNPSYATGISGQAFNFDGVDNYVQVPDSLDLSPEATTGEMTLSAWVKTSAYPPGPDSTGQPRRAIVAKGSYPADWEYALNLYANGAVEFAIWNPNGSNYGATAGGTLPLDGNWHLITGTMELGKFVRVYLDGVLVAQQVSSFSGSPAYGTSPLYIGRRGDGQFFNGQVDGAAVYNRSLSSAEVSGLYASAGASPVVSAGANAGGNTIQGNLIGTNAAGTATLANGGNGISIANSAGNTVGGATSAAGNVISGNSNNGVDITGTSATGNVVEGNYIGTNAAGTAALSNGDNGVSINNGASNTIGGTTAAARNIISGNRIDGVVISGSGATSNVVEGNYIGTDLTGTTAVQAVNNGHDGVLIFNGAQNNTIGGSTAASRNLISGNVWRGVEIDANSNTVQSNYIGVNAAGTGALGNGGDGVSIIDASNNQIGGAGAGNVISGNSRVGIWTFGSNNNTVAGNLIGTNAAGAAALGNGIWGIALQGGSSNNQIGGSSAALRNVISGNTPGGVLISDTGTTGNVLEGNYIGTNAAGTAALQNAGEGVVVSASGNTIGGLTGTPGTGAGNVISGNEYNGIHIENASNTQIEGNLIGSNAAGAAALANGYQGVEIDGGASNTVGGTAAGAGNVISANHGGFGNILIAFGATQVAVQGNHIGTDITGTIALGYDGYTDGIDIYGSSNDTIGGTTAAARNVISGNNNGIYIANASNFYGYTGASTGNVVEGNYIGTSVAGTASAVAVANDGFESPNQGATVTSYTYAPTGAGWTFVGGAGITANNTYWGVTDAINGNSDGTTSSAGQAAFIQGGNGTASGSAFYQTITGFSGGAVSIEFSLQGRNNFGTNPIKVMLDGQVLGTYTPSSTSVFQTIITRSVTVTAGAHTLYFIGTNSTGDTGAFIDNVRINIGNRGAGIAVAAGASNNTIGGSAAGAGNVISGNAGSGISIDAASHNNTIAGNHIGTDAGGNLVLGNANDGVSISGASNTVGGNTPGSGNVISGNNNDGVLINGASATSNTIAGNYIGTNAAGTAALSNEIYGVQVTGGAQSNVIGTNGDGVNDAAEGNLISGNDSWGVDMDGLGTNNNVLAGNYIGTDKTGMSAVPNGTPPTLGGGGGILVYNQAANNRIGTNGDGVSDDLERNVISGNSGWDGILLQTVNNNVVAGNYIGVAADGLTALGNATGIDIKRGSQGNRIGVNPADPDSTAERNVIAGNGGDGIDIWDNGQTTPTNNVVAGNYIGTDKTGAKALGNAGNGIAIYNGAQNNVIGGTASGSGNVISGNAQNGVLISDTGTTGNILEGNFIGINASGAAAVANAGNGVFITNSASSNTVGGLTSTPGTGAGNVISGNLQRGIWISGSSNQIEGNLIGTNAAGAAALGNGFQGVQIESGTGNDVGGTAAGAGNVISANAGPFGGILISFGASQSLIQGNYIGTDITGTVALGNATDGIEIIGSSNDTVGGTTAAARNVISGNKRNGIYLIDAVNFFGYNAPSTGNVVEGDYIGTNAAGTAVLGNQQSGVYINASGNTVGGPSSVDPTTGKLSGAGNLISGNLASGVQVASGTGNAIQGNFIGTDVTGEAALGNDPTGANDGIDLLGGSNDTIGGVSSVDAHGYLSGLGNLISGNTGTSTGNTSAGVYIATSSNVLEGNFVGTDVTGTKALGNANAGVLINGANNTIGGVTAGQGNTIADNGGAGVAVIGWTSTQDSIRGNLIFANTGLGIDLGDTGTILANDSQGHTGPNKNANYPVLGFVTAGPNTAVDGSLQNASTPGTIYYLDFYANSTQNTSGHGDAQVYLGSATVTTDSNGLAFFNVGGLGATSPGQYVTATATDASGNTSEFALNAVPAIVDSPPSVSITGPASMPASGIPVALGSTVIDSQTGKTYTYSWNVTSPTNPSFTLPTGTVTDEPNLTFTPSSAGTYIATLTVTDSLGGVGQATPLTITVNSGGQIVAINNAPANAAINAPLTLSAAVTEPPGVSVNNYAWNVTLNGAAYTQSSGPAASTFTFTPATAGAYVVTLTATNSAGATGSTSVSFTAVAPGVTIQGAPQSAGVGTPITVGAAVNDPNLSGALTYNWSVTSNGTTVASSPTDSTGFFTFTPTQLGSYVFSLAVSDAHGNTIAAAPVTLQVVSQAPGVSITGAPAGDLVGDSLSLGSQVTEPVGLTTAAYAWSIFKNGVPYVPAVHSDATSPSFSFTPDTGGLYTVTLLVTDSQGTVGGSSVSILVSSGAVAIGGLSPSVGEGTPVTLTATPVDPNVNGTENYYWSVTNTAGLPGLSGTGASFTFTPSQEGSYTIGLTATNSSNQVLSTATATLAVTNVSPTVTISGVPTSSTAGMPITLTGSANTPGSTDTFTYVWGLLGTNGQTTTASGSTLTFTPTGGPNLVTLTATDEAGGSASTSVVIAAGQAAGGIQLSQDGAFQEGGQATMQAALVSPPAGVSYSFSWTVSGQSVPYSATGNGTLLTSASSSFPFTPPAPGTYLVSVTAQGSDGSTASASELVTVANVPPTVSITGLPTTFIDEGTEVNLGANVSDPGLPNDVMKYQWTVTGPNNNVLTGSAANLSFIPDESGLYAVSLTVTDDSGAAVTTTANFTVAHVSPVPLIENAAGTGVNGSTLTVNLTASVPDPGNDDTFVYAWSAYDQTTSQTVATGSDASFSFSATVGDALVVSLTVTDAEGGDISATVPILVAQVGQTLTLSPAALPSGTTQALALALGSAEIDGSALTVPFDAAALGSHDTLIGGSGPNVLQGDSGFNSLLGGSGPNTLIATAGDSLLGGSGTNLFSITPGAGESVQSGGANNTLSFAGSSTGITLNLSQVSNSQQTQFAGYDGTSTDILSLQGTFQNLVGSAGADNLFAANNSIVYGGGGNDTLTASGISDATLAAGSGNVVLSATGSSNVLLFAGTGTLGGSSTSGIGNPSVSLAGGAGNSSLSVSAGGDDTLQAQNSSNVTMIAATGTATLASTGGSNIQQFGGTGNDSLYSSGGSSIYMQGGTGNTTLSSTGGSSITQFGGTGNDSLYSSGGSSVYMQGGTGNTTLSSSGGSSITQFGGTGNDSLYSSGGSSIYMQGGSGNTTLSSTGGSSITQFGGTGNDSLYSSGGSSIYMQGGTGNSTLSSTAGSSITQFGGTGNDSLYSSGGSSVLMVGGSGNATLSSSGGSSITQFGGTGNDSLYSSGGSSVYMQGGSGNTTLSSTGGSSITQFGGTGNDSLYSSGGSSVYMQGGTGNSTLSSTAGSSITQFGGTGNDSLYSSGGSSIYMQGGTGNTTLSSTGGSSITQFGGTGNDSLYSSGGSSVYMQGGTGNSTLSSTGGSSITQFGGTGNDSLYSSGGSSIYMQGGTGNTTLSSTGGSSITQFGGTGSDSLYSSGGSSIYMQGGSGNTTLSSSGSSSITQFGGTGNDSLYSSGGSSVLMVGGSGNTTLSSSGGSSITQFGGTGNDSLYSSGGSSIYMQGGSGNTTLSSSGGSSITQFGGTGNDSMYSSGGSSIYMQGGTGNSTLSSSGGSSITQFGGTGNDSLYSSGGSSVLMVGGSGNTTLSSSGDSSITQFGGTGNDSLYSSGGSSIYMQGGSGNTTLSSTGGSSITQFGGTGNDSLYSSGGSSVLMVGGSGNTTLSSNGGSSITQFGGTGSDSLYSSGGSSIYMQGGTGSSTLSSTGGSSITQFGGTGNDSLYSSGGSSIYMQGGSGSSTLSSSGGSSITQFGGTGNDSLYSSGGSSVLMVGGSGNTTLSSSGGSSITQFGGTGNDSLYSSGGSSVLMIGGNGNSTLSSSGGSSITQFGGTGNDSLYSSGGSSIYMQGGSGNSTLSSTGGSSITQFGGTGNDSLYSTGGSSVLMVGGSGNTTLSSSGGSSITQFGGTGNDSLYSTGGSSIYMQGGSGNTTLSSTGGSSITQFGGSGNDSLYSSGGSSILMVGGSGTDSLTASGDANALMQAGGATNDLLTAIGGSSVSLVGGSGNDTLSADGGTGIVLAGLDGDNTFELSGNVSVSLNDLSTFGQSLPNVDGATQGINTILFPGLTSGIHLDLSNFSDGAAPSANQFQNVAAGMNLSLVGQFQNVVGGAGDNWIRGNASGNLLQGGGSGGDTLIAGNGPATLLAGSGNDSLVGGSGGTVYRFAGNSFGSDTISPSSSASNDTLDFSQLGGAVNLNLVTSAPQSVSPATGLTLTLANPLGITGVIDTASTANPYNDAITGNDRGDVFAVGTGNDTITGSGGDSFSFSGTHLGSDVLNEAAGTQNSLNFLGLGAPVNLNLSQPVNAAAVSPGNLTLTLSNPSAFTTVVGTPYADNITGNSSNDTLIGAGGEDSLVGGSGSNYVQGDITQVVYLHFPTSGLPGDLIYTAAEANAIQTALASDYSGFNYVFTQDPNQAQQLAQMTGGKYVTLNFGTGPAGGASNQLDVDHLHLDGSATIDITSFLGQAPGLVAPTLSNIINLTTTIAAHELGHLSGLQHQDAFGPIGSGIYAGVNPQLFYPYYTGPTGATQTPNDVMASPDSVGTTLEDAAGQTYLGERDLIKLAFNDTGVQLSQSNLSSVQAVTSNPTGSDVVLPDAGTVYELGNLPVLAVPNTLPAGVPGAGQTFAVTAVGVNATIQTGQVQYYAIQASAGELMSFQVISGTNTLNPHPILPALEVLDANGNLVPYAGNDTASSFYGAGAVNQHEFESNDSSLYDVTLPTTGTYYVGVTTLPFSPSGNYQLFTYSFGTAPPSQTAGDTLVGGSGAGNDTLVGSSGNDTIRFLPGYTGQATVYSGSGQDTLDLSDLTVTNPLGHISVTNQSKAYNMTVTTVSASTESSLPVYGGAVTLTATVTAFNNTSNPATPTGSVTFYNNGTSLGSATLSGGSASLTLSTLPAGVENITAKYTSDNDQFDSSTSQTFVQAIAQAQPSFSNLTSSQTIAYGTPTIALSGHLTANAGQQTIPAGESVTATIDGVSQSAALDGNDNFALAFNTSTVSASATPWTITYSYGGDNNFKAAADASTTLSITTVATTTSVPSSTVTSDFGQPLTLTATVATQPSSSLVPTGSVVFFDNTTQTDLGSIALSVNGTAQLVTDDLPAGTQTITLTFADPQKNFLTSSTTVSVTIVPSIYVLNPTASGALSLAGTSTLTTPGLVVVDSNSATAFVESGTDKIAASGIELVGGASISSSSSLSPAPTYLSAPAPDPLATLPIPSATGLPLQGSVNLGNSAALTINPGIYSSINVSGQAVLTMNPGIYVIAGGGFAVTSGASVTGSGVLIYNAGSNYNGGTGTSFGGLTLTGTGTINLSPAATGPYAGIVLFQSRDNTRAISLSGKGVVGLGGGILYAPSALLSLSGNVQLGSPTTPSGPLVVNQLQLLGNTTSDLSADNGTDDTSSNTAGQLLAGNVTVYVDNSSNSFTADELARIQDAVNSANATVATYGVTVSEVDAAHSAYATTIITQSASSASGGAADGVLGCESDTGITLVSGWNWYTGPDPSAIGSGQYDFETIVLHELGHALGLGHSALSSSVMYATLDPGTTKRTLTTADLNIPDTGNGPCALHAVIPEEGSNGPSLENPQTPLPAANGPLAAAMRAIEPGLLLSEASSGEAIESTLVATNMGWLQKWAWLMLGLGQDPSRTSVVPDNEADTLAVGGYLTTRPVDNQSSAGLGSSRNAAGDTDGSATVPGPSDIAVLDRFFEQASDDGMDEEATIAAIDY